MTDETGREVSRNPVIETARLRLRPCRADDRTHLHALWTQPAVRKYLFDDVLVPLDQVGREIRASQLSFARHGVGLWVVLRRTDQGFIGFTGYREFHQPPELQLLYGLSPTVWGRGFATEAARAVVRYGFEEIGFDRIIASADAHNADSFGVMDRVGMRFDKRVHINDLDTIYYSIARADYVPDDPYSLTYEATTGD